MELMCDGDNIMAYEVRGVEVWTQLVSRDKRVITGTSQRRSGAIPKALLFPHTYHHRSESTAFKMLRRHACISQNTQSDLCHEFMDGLDRGLFSDCGP
jgi:hypothetical protein